MAAKSSANGSTAEPRPKVLYVRVAIEGLAAAVLALNTLSVRGLESQAETAALSLKHLAEDSREARDEAKALRTLVLDHEKRISKLEGAAGK